MTTRTASVTDGIVVNISECNLEELLTGDDAALSTTLDRILAPDINCANSFQSSI
jgi:hypothetical protein